MAAYNRGSPVQVLGRDIVSCREDSKHVVNNYHLFHISNFVTEKMASSDAAAFVFVMRLDGKATGLIYLFS